MIIDITHNSHVVDRWLMDGINHFQYMKRCDPTGILISNDTFQKLERILDKKPKYFEHNYKDRPITFHGVKVFRTQDISGNKIQIF